MFNLIVGNGDAHLKNLSFLPTRTGTELAPHYDLLSTSVWREGGWGLDEMTTPMGDAVAFAKVRRADVLEFGKCCEARLLRLIVHGPVRDMLRQLSA